jgi:hypothetical protein
MPEKTQRYCLTTMAPSSQEAALLSPNHLLYCKVIFFDIQFFDHHLETHPRWLGLY